MSGSTQDFVIRLKLDGEDQLSKVFSELKEKYNIQATLDNTKIKASLEQVHTGIKGVFHNLRTEVSQMGFALQGVFNIGAVVDKYFGAMIREAIEAEQGMTKVSQAIRSTGAAAGWGAEGLKAVADQLERTTAVDADEIMNKITLPLLTFTKITGGVLPEAQEAVLNMSRALGVDLQGAAMQVGKALQDPTVGLTALRRSGVSFSDDQVKVIKNLVETGRAAEAQKLILAELNKEFGGQAAAYAQTYAGKLEAFKISFKNLQESIGKGLLPVLTTLVKPISVLFGWFNSMGTAMQTIVALLPLAVAGIYRYNAAAIAGTITSGGLTGAITMVGTAIKGFIATLGPVGLILTLLGLLAMLVENTIGWGKAWIYIKNYSVAALTIAWEYLKGFGVFLWNFTSGMIQVLTLPWQIMYRTAVNLFSKLASIMKKLVSGDFAGVWQEIKTGFTDGFNDSINSVKGAFAKAFDAFEGQAARTSAIWNKAGTDAQAALIKANTTVTRVPGQVPGLGGGDSDPGSSETPEAKAKRLAEEADAALKAKLEAEKAYYEEVKFADAGYYNWKLGQITAEVDAMQAANQEMTADQRKTLLDMRTAELDAERDKPVNDLIDKYKELMGTMADSKTVGVQSWNGIADALSKLREEMLPLADNAEIAAKIKELNEKILIAQGNAAKETKKTNWLWKLLGFDEDKEGDKAKIRATLASYQTIMSGISEITNSVIQQNNQKRQAELARIDEIAAKEKWSAEEVAAKKDAVNKKYADRDRQMKNIQKGMSIIQAGINTAESVTKALTAGPILGPILAGIIGAMGAVQIAFIKAQKFGWGGLFRGKGGPREDANLAWLSNGEYVVNAAATAENFNVLEAINRGKYRPILPTGSGLPALANGGLNTGNTGTAEIRQIVREEVGKITVVIDARNPDAKTWARHIKVGEMQLAAATL